jgi:hypothetical protein
VMFAQVIVGLDDGDEMFHPRRGAAIRAGNEGRCNGLTLMRVVTVGFLTVINGHVR